MTLADWADVATIAASILAVLGVGWLVFVQVRRHRSAREDFEVLITKAKSSNEAGREVGEALTKLMSESHKVPPSIEVIASVIGMHLDYMSSQLEVLQLIGMADYLRQYNDDERIASLLANWKLRSPITRRE